MKHTQPPTLQTIKVRVVDIKRLKAKKAHPRQAYWEVVASLLTSCKEVKA